MRALGRTAASISLVSAVAHLLIAVGPAGGSLRDRLLLLLMMLACLACASALWRSPAPGVWVHTSVMYAAMAGAHQLLGHAPVMQMSMPAGGHAMNGASARWGQVHAVAHGIPYLQLAIGGTALLRLAPSTLSTGERQPLRRSHQPASRGIEP